MVHKPKRPTTKEAYTVGGPQVTAQIDRNAVKFHPLTQLKVC